MLKISEDLDECSCHVVRYVAVTAAKRTHNLEDETDVLTVLQHRAECY